MWKTSICWPGTYLNELKEHFNCSLVRKIPRIQLNTKTYNNNGKKSSATRVQVEATPACVLCGSLPMEVNKMLDMSQGWDSHMYTLGSYEKCEGCLQNKRWHAAINKHLIRTKIMLEGNVTPKLVISVVGFNLESVLIVSTQLGVKWFLSKTWCCKACEHTNLKKGPMF